MTFYSQKFSTGEKNLPFLPLALTDEILSCSKDYKECIMTIKVWVEINFIFL